MSESPLVLCVMTQNDAEGGGPGGPLWREGVDPVAMLFSGIFLVYYRKSSSCKRVKAP